MKRLVLIALIVVCTAGVASAQLPGSIGVFSDAAGTSCNFTDVGGLVQVHMFHLWTDGSTACTFQLVVPAGYTHLGDIMNYAAIIDNTVAGISIGYGTCVPGPNYLGYANFLGAIAPACSYISIVPHPSAPSGDIEAVDCNVPEVKFFPTGGQGIVNPTVDCDCNVPVEETTWGGIKSLYQ